MDDFREIKPAAGWVLKGLSPGGVTGRIVFFALVLIALATGALFLKTGISWVDKPFAGFLMNRRMVVGYIGQYYWTGTQAGLKYPDKILKANGMDVASMKDMEEVVKSSEVGSSITYTVERDGKMSEVSLPTMRFTTVDLLTTFGVFFILGIVYLAIGAAVFVLKPDTEVSWVVVAACFLESTSNFAAFDMESSHLVPMKLLILINLILPAVVMHLSLIFPERSRLIERYPYIKLAPYAVATVLLVPLELLYPRPLFMIFYKVVILYTNISILALIASALHSFFRKSSVLARQRAKVVLFGAVIALPVPAVAPLIASMGGTLGGMRIITNFSAILTVVFPASIAYAIARHNLFDVDVYIKRTLVYGTMVAFVVTVDFTVHLIIEPLILHPIFGDNAKKIYPILIALMVVLLFHPVLHEVQKIVDALFFRKKFNYKDTVISVSNALTSILRPEEIIKRIILTVKQDMYIDSAGVILPRPVSAECKSLFITDGDRESIHQLGEECSQDDPLMALVSREKKIVSIYDINEDSKYSRMREAYQRRFSEIGASIAVPLIYQNEVKGVLAVGNKKSGHFYTREDIDLLKTLSSSGAIAIENARIVDKTRKDDLAHTNLARYLAPEIVQRVMNDGMNVNLGGEKKTVTILACEMKRFGAITGSFPVEQAVRILNRCFTEMSRIIISNGGFLDKVVSGTFTAVFGGIIPHRAPDERALQTARQMIQAMPRLNRRLSKEYGVTIEIGIGISRGQVFQGNIGSPERMEFTVMGEAVDLAAQAAGLAADGRIVVTRTTLDNLKSEIQEVELLPAAEDGRETEMFKIQFS